MANLFKPSIPSLWKPPLGAQINRSHPLSQRLVGAWLMNEGGGKLAKDITGIGGDMSLTGPQWTVGKYGPTLSNNGSSGTYGKVTAGAGTPLDVTGNALSFGCWFYRTSSVSYEYVMGRDSAGTRQYSIIFGPGLNYIIQDGGRSGGIILDYSYALNTWNHLFFTYDGANVTPYLNGKKSTPYAATTPISSASGSSNVFLFEQVQGNYPLSGAIDIPLIYNRVLSAAEVQQLYLKPFSFMQPSRGIIMPGSAAAVTSRMWSFVG